MLDSTIQRVRKIASELRPSVLDNLGLTAAIEWQAHDFERRTGVECTFTPRLEELGLDSQRTTALFRIFQEILTNIARHAEARHVDIHLGRRNGIVILEVLDDGRGITKQELLDARSLGIVGMRERAFAFGGKVRILGTEGKGTKVTVQIPLNDL